MNANHASDEATHVYIGRVPGCGCVRAFAVDIPSDPKHTGRMVADIVKSGLQIERVSIADGVRLQKCTHRAREKSADAHADLNRALAEYVDEPLPDWLVQS